MFLQVEVIHEDEEEPPMTKEIFEIIETPLIIPSSPPVKKTKFSEQSFTQIQAPTFVSTLADAEVPEGSKFVFECKWVVENLFLQIDLIVLSHAHSFPEFEFQSQR